MKFTITGKNIMLTDGLRDNVERKLGRLEKYFNQEIDIQATLGVQKSRHIIEVTIPFNGIILRAEEATEDMYTSIDNVVEKLERQIRKHKTRIERRLHEGTLRLTEVPRYEGEEDSDPQVVKTKRFAIKPMHTEEAVLQMDLLGHNFFVFQNADSEEVNVVYKRRDGNYGLIEPEF